MSTPESSEEACAVLHGFLDRLACVAKTDTMDSMASSDLTFTQFRVMCAVGASEEAISVHEIGDAIRLSLAATGRTVDSLVRQNFLDRREDSADRRVKRITLTELGQRFLDEQLAVKKDLVTAFLAGLPDQLRTGLVRALRPIVDADVDFFDLTPATCRPAHE
ncbi:MarR family winged helix-turn-helix transcriptional regulator [Gordonia desulfuricans]|nr:MarR family transcriptional regulator [Gordonia desulfuricans]